MPTQPDVPRGRRGSGRRRHGARQEAAAPSGQRGDVRRRRFARAAAGGRGDAWSIFGGPGLIQIPAAARALARGDKRPLLRTVAENRILPAAADSGDPTRFSRGDSLAVLCNEQRFPWDWSTTSAARRAHWASALAALPAGSFGPFSASAVSADPQESAAACREWPAPASSEPPVPDGATYPAVPALVIGGDLDGAVPDVARTYASQFPTSSYVEFANVGHGAAFSGPCATTILRRFVSELAPGDTSCAAHPVAIFGYSTFPRRARDVRHARSACPATGRFAVTASPPPPRSRPCSTRRSMAPAATVSAQANALARRPATSRHRCRFVEDIAVSGSGHVDLSAATLSARVRLAGTSNATLRIRPRGSKLAVTGGSARRSIRLLVSVNN